MRGNTDSGPIDPTGQKPENSIVTCIFLVEFTFAAHCCRGQEVQFSPEVCNQPRAGSPSSVANTADGLKS